jgi:hypothetical protein
VVTIRQRLLGPVAFGSLHPEISQTVLARLAKASIERASFLHDLEKAERIGLAHRGRDRVAMQIVFDEMIIG